MKNIKITAVLLLLIAVLAIYPMQGAQNNKAATPQVGEIQKQKQDADKEIKETKKELGANEKKVTESLNALKKIDEDIAVSQKEIATVQGQLDNLKGAIQKLETGIKGHEEDLDYLRDEYLKSVKKMRVARKKNSGLVFLFASKNLSDAKRRLRYMKEFSDWRGRRTDEINGKVAVLNGERQELVQARADVAVALKREQTAQSRLSDQRNQQQVTVTQLRANSDALKSKLARRQAEARQLSNQISRLVAEQQAKEAAEREARMKLEAEQQRLAAEKKAAEERRLAEEKARQEAALAKNTQPSQPKQNTEKAKQPSAPTSVNPGTTSTPDKSEYANARRRKSRAATPTEQPGEAIAKAPAAEPAAKPAPVQNKPAESGFGSMKGSLPRPVNGSFKIVSAFGVHPISPELPDIMDENLGIDAHVSNGASACAVYDGEVIKIYDRTTTPGFRNIVVVKHGDYITVYANLETLAVKTGQKVKQGQSLGSVGADFDNPNYGMIHFEVWKNQTHLDPAGWIKI